MAKRNQHNLQGILQFAVEQTKLEDSSVEHTMVEVDDERKQFLENVLKTMTVDVMEEFQKAIFVLENSSSDEDIIEALKIIQEYVDDIDFANSFVKVGGGKIILRYLQVENCRVRVIALNIIAEISQNNPFCQKYFIESNILPLLRTFFNEDEDVTSSALHSVSSLIRQYAPGVAEFTRIDGPKTLLRCLNSHSPRVVAKACFLIAYLASESDNIKDAIIQESAIEKLCANLAIISGFDMKTESILFALSTLKLGTNIPDDAVVILQQIIDQNKNLSECEEIVTYAREILRSHKSQDNV